MAKREVPEINAGSMADIAFLLLIFFLVTTTMDRDQAYQRRIPKPVESDIIPPPSEPRNIFAIKANNQGQLMVVDRFNTIESDEISDKIIEFVTMNRGLSQDQTNAYVQDQTYKGFNFPFYSRATKSFLVESRNTDFDNLDAAEASGDDEKATFYLSKIAEWNKKISVLDFLKLSELVEITSAAHVRVEVMPKTPYELLVKIHSEIAEATYALRDEAAKALDWDTYSVIKRRFEINEGDPSKEDLVKEDRKKMDALELLYPMVVIEVNPNK